MRSFPFDFHLSLTVVTSRREFAQPLGSAFANVHERNHSPSGESSLSEERGDPNCASFDFALVKKNLPSLNTLPPRGRVLSIPANQQLKSGTISKGRRVKSVRGNGFTLIEVVVGLALMATVLVGSLLSFSAHRKQLRIAEQKIAAVAVADELLQRFSGQREGIPKARQGPLAGHPNWLWQTSIAGIAQPLGTPVQLIRLRVIEILPDGSLLTLATVDVVERLP